MEYSKLISVSGMSGLFELMTSKTDGAIATSLENNNTQFISSRAHQFSHLESIEVYTTHENVFLAEVFIAMKSAKEALPNEKDVKAVTAYFKKVFPKMDFERVYGSDMKKMVKWYAQLEKHNVEPVIPADEESDEA
jgi:predicted RND superfamily exporter protein